MNYDIHEINRQLSVWGTWRVKVIEMGVGYSNMSIFGKIHEDGGFLPSSTSIRNIPGNLCAEQIDTLVNELSRCDPLCAKALTIRYTAKNEKLALAKIEMSKGSYDNYLRMGKMWLCGRLSSLSFC